MFSFKYLCLSVCVVKAAFRQDSCQDRFCSDHEFCGVRSYSGQTGCICRAIFASKYQSTSSFGESILTEESLK